MRGGMADGHWTAVLVTSCLKAPVGLRDAAAGHVDDRDDEQEVTEITLINFVTPSKLDSEDLGGIFSSHEEYYGKLEELKEAQRRTMAELESTYRRKLQLGAVATEAGRRAWPNSSPAAPRLRRSRSAVELRGGSGPSDSSDEGGCAASPKDHIRNMWSDFKPTPRRRQPSASSLPSLPGDPRRRAARETRGKEREEPGKHRVTVTRPFQMMLCEAERRRRGLKSRSETELENAALRRQLEELTECQRKFRASPAPAHVRLPVQEEEQERRTRTHLSTVPKPFSFLERERLKKERKPPSEQEKVKPFKAKPAPKAVQVASGEQAKEAELHRANKIQMRAQEMLRGASMPPGMLTRRVAERRKAKDEGGRDGSAHRPQTSGEVPDFAARYRRFQRHLEKHREVKPTTACQPFDLRTSQISSHRERVLADIERDRSSPRARRWPYVGPGPPRTPGSSLCSSLSGSLEFLPAKATDATRKRHQAVRKVLEQRKEAEEEAELWRARQKRREKTLQRVVLTRARANDPHLALSQTHLSRLKEFRRQEQQRRKEYQQEIKEMQQRVEGRPLLLEQVAQRNAKQAAEKRFTDTLRGAELTHEFISSTAARSGSGSGSGSRSGSESSTSASSDRKHSRHPEELDPRNQPVHDRKDFLDEDVEVDPRSREASSKRQDEDDEGGDESCASSDDHQYYSDDSDHD
ncbi:protein FAM161B [Brachionichthys hirsutus]|uniref:protein FAM161B n=1 Tax=Brachionichthys hirsutus TaxID=412623 RepID=UPI003604D896